ncbi:MAG: peptidoglycan-binding protein, partial [Candidatus Omnitrophica bacterium]|nr:peptidoglycan-binding protein [Candidatus Omnitrophota bacterium]
QMKGTNISIKSRPGKGSERIKDIQACLKSAGYYSGSIDGVKGPMTKKAIKEFQRANGLEADGIVGKRTWEILSKYQSGGN